jgi:dimethylamine monooxygenase subunit A
MEAATAMLPPDTRPYYTLPATAHRLALGARSLAEGPLIEVDRPAYGEEVVLKQAILASAHAYYFQAQPHSTAAQWEAAALILHDLCRYYPDEFALTRTGDEWTWSNRLQGTCVQFRFGDAGSLPWAPLDWVGRQVQEDLLLLDGSDSRAGDAAFRLMGGQLCFPNRWSLDEKMGLSFLDIHEPVPEFRAQIGRSSNLLLARLKPGRPVWRYNWSLVMSSELDLSTRVYAGVHARSANVTAANCGAMCFFRTERQTLARLPRTDSILFTVHTYRTALANLACSGDWSQRFLEVLNQADAPFLAYKGVTPVEEPLRQYLEWQVAGGGVTEKTTSSKP